MGAKYLAINTQLKADKVFGEMTVFTTGSCGLKSKAERWFVLTALQFEETVQFILHLWIEIHSSNIGRAYCTPI
jgi:hypothetical protein